ncbi:MAG TPA: SAM-dependent methyltransferase [Polyangia bacterium]|nr:SAM-dependent methyltransferase [Polyangia bacterium]
MLLSALATASSPAYAADADAAACNSDDLLAGRAPVSQDRVTGNARLATDGNVVPEGALWDGPAMMQLESGGSVTWDLGRVRSIAAIVGQADANDTYVISASPDGKAGTFVNIAQLANVVDAGPGMRTRALRIAPTTARFIRIGNGEGDGAYSVAELAVYCKAPQPFPPAFSKIEAPMAAVPAPPNEHYVTAVDGGDRPTTPAFEMGLAVVALLLLAGMIVAATRGQPGAREAVSARERYYPVVLLLFIGSGCAALIYEVIWLQLLQLVLGSSAVSIGVLLATFMAGMCIGSLGLSRYVSRRRHPLRVYAVIELAVGACGLLVLAEMPLVQRAYVAVAAHGASGLAVRGLFAAVCLLPPTILMGATLPAIARWVETTPRGVSWLGFFYGGNTVGAVSGCLLAGFYLLRVSDMPTATFVAVGLNVLVTVAAWALSAVTPGDLAHEPPAAAAQPAALPDLAPLYGRRAARAAYLIIGLSGMTALGAEVVWTRLFTLLMGGTTYTFSIILGVFLCGISLGSGVGSAVERRTSDPVRALGYAQLMLVAAIAWTAWNLTASLPYWPVNPAIGGGAWYLFQTDLARCFWAILPAALLWGASFPLAMGAVVRGAPDGGRVVGRVYAANTVGAIVGALFFSLAAIPWFGTRKSEYLLIGMAALSALIALGPVFGAAAAPGSLAGRIGGPARAAGAAVVIALFAVVAARRVAPVPAILIGHGRHTPLAIQNHENFLFVGEGMNSSMGVSRDQNGILSYHNAGKTQASSQPQDMRLQRMLGHLTTLIPEHPRKVLVVACGAGVTAGAASIDPRVEHQTIAEIEALVPKVVAEYFGDYNFNVVRNPKVHVVVDDARHFLTSTDQTFDAITSDPFDPWVKGAASLYTLEFWELAKRHLNPGGVVTVFVQLYESGTAAVKSEIATFFQAFPKGLIFGNTNQGQGYDVVLVGQAEGTHLDVDRLEALFQKPEMAGVVRSLREIGYDSATSLLSTYAARASDLGPWLADAQINRDRNLRLQFLAGMDYNKNEAAEIYRGILQYRQSPPADLFTGTPATLAALNSAILGRHY